MLDLHGYGEQPPVATRVEEELRRLVRERLDDRSDPPRPALDEGARAWVIGPAPRSRRR